MGHKEGGLMKRSSPINAGVVYLVTDTEATTSLSKGAPDGMLIGPHGVTSIRILVEETGFGPARPVCLAVGGAPVS